MSSIIKVGKVQSSTGQDAITIADSGAITATNIQTDSIKDDSGTRVLASDSGSAWSWGSGCPSDTIIQVKHTIKTDTTNQLNDNASIDWEDIAGMSCNITPATGNKVLVNVNLNVGSTSGHFNNVKIVRGSDDVFVGNQEGTGRPRATFGWRGETTVTMFNLCGSFLDESPGGNGSTQLTYKVQWCGEQNGTMYLNRMLTGTDNYYHGRYTSSIILMEVKG